MKCCLQVPASMQPADKAPDLTVDMRSTGLNHIAFDVGPAIEAIESSEDGLRGFLTELNRQAKHAPPVNFPRNDKTLTTQVPNRSITPRPERCLCAAVSRVHLRQSSPCFARFLRYFIPRISVFRVGLRKLPGVHFDFMLPEGYSFYPAFSASISFHLIFVPSPTPRGCRRVSFELNSRPFIETISCAERRDVRHERAIGRQSIRTGQSTSTENGLNGCVTRRVDSSRARSSIVGTAQWNK